MDLLKRRVTRAGSRSNLLQREVQILEQLLRHKDKVVTRTMLLEQVWDYRFDPHTSMIDTHMRSLGRRRGRFRHAARSYHPQRRLPLSETP